MSLDSHQDFDSLEVTGSIEKLSYLFSVNPVGSMEWVISKETRNNIRSKKKKFLFFFHLVVADDYELLGFIRVDNCRKEPLN